VYEGDREDQGVLLMRDSCHLPVHWGSRRCCHWSSLVMTMTDDYDVMVVMVILMIVLLGRQ
jgi:hypothetical protein